MNPDIRWAHTEHEVRRRIQAYFSKLGCPFHLSDQTFKWLKVVLVSGVRNTSRHVTYSLDNDDEDDSQNQHLESWHIVFLSKAAHILPQDTQPDGITCPTKNPLFLIYQHHEIIAPVSEFRLLMVPHSYHSTSSPLKVLDQLVNLLASSFIFNLHGHINNTPGSRTGKVFNNFHIACAQTSIDLHHGSEHPTRAERQALR